MGSLGRMMAVICMLMMGSFVFLCVVVPVLAIALPNFFQHGQIQEPVAPNGIRLDSYPGAVTIDLPFWHDDGFQVFVMGVAAFVGLLIFMIAWRLTRRMASPPPQQAQANAEETRMMQELYQGLARMEDRLEVLETLLLDRERASKEYN